MSDDVIYVGTDAGVYMEDFNTPQRWVKLSGGLPNVQVADVEVNVTTRTLTAGTHGRGAWQLMLDLPGSISGRVITDFDADGLLDANESVVPNLTVFHDANDNKAFDLGETFTTTSASGDYTLGNLTQGTYRVRPATLANHVIAAPAGGTMVIEISNGVNFIAKDFTQFPVTYSGSGGNDSYLLRLNPLAASMVQIIQMIGTLVEMFTVATAALTAANATLTFDPGNGDDLLTIDHTSGVPYGSGGAMYLGGAQSTPTGDRLIITGSSGTDNFTVIETAITNSGSVSYSQLESIQIDTLGGNDTISISGALSTPFRFTAGTGSFDTLNLSGGASYTFTQDARNESSNLGISLSGTSAVSFNTTQHLRSLILGASSRATLSTSGSAYLQTRFLSIAASARLDLNDNDFILDYSDGLSGSGVYTTIEGWVLNGYAKPNGFGIVSTSSLSAPGAPILALFDNTFIEKTEWPPGSGNLVPQNSVIGKYTFFGDMNIDGKVTGDDYTIVDANMGLNPAPQRIRWLLGDANLDGQISGDDYTVIDANQGAGVGSPL
jgi:hypothetical protein